MEISKKDVDYVASLARLEFNEKDKESLTQQLGSILNYIEKIKEVDTSRENFWREDKVIKSSQKTIDAIFKNAPDKEADFFKVKKVMDTEEE